MLCIIIFTDIESISDLASLNIHPDGTTPEIAVLAYQNYNFDHEYNKSLPITAHHDQVCTMTIWVKMNELFVVGKASIFLYM